MGVCSFRWFSSLKGYTLTCRASASRSPTFTERKIHYLALIANGIITALLAVFVDQVLHAGSVGLGLMFTTRGVGGLIGSILVGHLANRLSPGHLIAPSLAAVGALFLLLFNIPIFSLTIIFTALLGPAMMGWLVSGQTLLQTNVAEQYLGRVFGAYGTTAAIAGLVGTGVASALGNSATLVTLLNIGAVLYILAGIVAFSVIQKYHLATAQSVELGN